jgi:hypothetical protein
MGYVKQTSYVMLLKADGAADPVAKGAMVALY